MNNFGQLLAEAKEELESLSRDQKIDLMGGYDNRGLDCISERWYLPDEMRKSSALATLGTLILNVDNLLRDFYNENEALFEEGDDNIRY